MVRLGMGAEGCNRARGGVAMRAWDFPRRAGRAKWASAKWARLSILAAVPATLTSLRIRNLALVEELAWTLAPGFTAVTGETGSGKSIIVGALQLILGERAEKALIRTGAESCTVEAVFAVKENAALNVQLEEQGVEPCEEAQ